MKVKFSLLFVLLVSVLFLSPVFCNALSGGGDNPPTPMANVKITIDTDHESDHLFGLQTIYDEYDPMLDYYYTIYIETENLHGEDGQDIVVSGRRYFLEKKLSEGDTIDYVKCTSDHTDTTFNYQPDGVYFTPVDGENIICAFSDKPFNQKNPVLIVPGLMGTEISKDANLLWANIGNMLTSVTDNFLDPLQFNKNLNTTDNVTTGNIIGSPVATQHFYDLLINEFKGQGYVEDETLFTFPYDWRYGASGKYSNGKTNSDLLKEKIDEILVQTGASKVDVVAHSLGGLIVKKYVADNVADNHIGKAVFVGVPSTGAPKAVKVLLQGDNFGILGLNDAEMKKISENLPVSYDLLPSRQYYNSKGSFVEVADATQGTDKNLSYDETKSFLTGEHNLNALAMQGSENLHNSDFDNFDLRTAGIDLYAIDGCRAATLSKVVERKNTNAFGNSVVDYLRPAVSFGDGTVPLESATNLPIDQSHKFYLLNANHSKMMSQDGGRQEIVNLISGSNLAMPTDFLAGDPKTGELLTQDISKCALNGKAISVFSPVDISVADQNGNKLGLGQDDSITNEIPNADFEVWGEHKFLFLPTDNGQVYNVGMQGTGSGTCTIKLQDVSNSQIVKTSAFYNLPVTPQLTGSINLANTTLTVAGQTITPSATAQGSDIVDATPPEAMINFDPAKKDIVFSATDNATASENIFMEDRDNSVLLRDEAGNKTEINFKDKNRKRIMQAEIKSIVYNGAGADIGKNLMQFVWSYDKSGNLKSLLQHVKSKGDYNILAIYDGKNTALAGKDKTGIILKKLSGLKILKVTTNKGNFDWKIE